jgi:hypothetical protein
MTLGIRRQFAIATLSLALASQSALGANPTRPTREEFRSQLRQFCAEVVHPSPPAPVPGAKPFAVLNCQSCPAPDRPGSRPLFEERGLQALVVVKERQGLQGALEEAVKNVMTVGGEQNKRELFVRLIQNNGAALSDCPGWESFFTPPPSGPDAKPSPGSASKDLNVQGLRLYKQKRYLEAVQLFEQAIAAEPRHALAHYNLACTLALLRKSGQGCKQGARRSVILGHLARAVEIDGTRRDRMKVDADLEDVRASFAYQVLTGLSPTKSSDVKAILQRIVWVGPDAGVYGPASYLRFNADGICELRILDAVEEKVNWKVFKGSYGVQDNRVELTLEKAFAARKTHRGTLQADGRLTFESMPDNAPFTDGPPECAD